MDKLTIIGYAAECACEHCGRTLKHGVKLADGRIVGAQCLNAKLSAPRVRDGKKFRYGAAYIVKAAKCAQFVAPDRWSAYGISAQSMEFEAA